MLQQTFERPPGYDIHPASTPMDGRWRLLVFMTTQTTVSDMFQLIPLVFTLRNLVDANFPFKTCNQNLRFNSVISWAASFVCNIFIKWYNMLVSEFKRSDRAAISGNPTFGELKAVDSDDGEPASCKTASCLNNSLKLWKVHAIIVPASTL